MLVRLKQMHRILMSPILAIALLSVLLPALGQAAPAIPQPCVAPPAPTNLTPAPGPSMDTNPQFSWDQVPEALWYQIWITKDGAAFKSAWQYNNTYYNPPGPLASGTYRWWVRAWSPCGTGQWASGGAYVLSCDPLAKPAPSAPDGSTYTGYAENIDVDFDWESGYASWARFNIMRNGQPYLDQWVKLPYTSSYQYYDFGYGFFSNGNYTWQLREWASCGGISEWSDPLSFTVNGSPCTAAPEQGSINSVQTYSSVFNGTAFEDSSVRPRVYWNQLSETIWYQFQVLVDSEVFLTKWFNRETYWRATSDLPAGEIGFRVRGWNECGFGVWSPTETRTFSCETTGQVTGLDSLWCDYGYGIMAEFDALPGVSWYQAIIRKDGADVFNEWLDLDRDSFMLEDLYGQGRIRVRSLVPCMEGNYQAYVRAWSRPCGTTPWAGPIAMTPDCSTGDAMPLDPSGDINMVRPDFVWAEAPGAMGYELVLHRNGKPYHKEENDYFSRTCGWAERSEANSFDASSGVAQGWRADDSSWELELPFYFRFCGSSYDRCWVGSNGTISFGDPFNPTVASIEGLMDNRMISVLWEDLETDNNAADDVYVSMNDTSVTIRWQGTYFPNTGTINCSATLYRNGAVRLSYGAGNTQSNSQIGISEGNGTDYLLSAESGTAQPNADDVLFLPLKTWQPFWYLPLGDYQWWVRSSGICPDGATWSTAGGFSIVPTI